MNYFLLRRPFNTFSSFYLLQLLFVLSTTAKLTVAEQTVGAKDILFPNVRTTLLASATDVIFISLTA